MASQYRRNKKTIGKISYCEYRKNDRADWGELWRVTYRGAKFKIDKLAHSEEEARDIAREANLKREKIETGYDTQLTQAQEEEYKAVIAKLEIFNKQQTDSGDPNTHILKFTEVVELAQSIIEQTNAINKRPDRKGGLIYKPKDVIYEGASLIKRKNARVQKPLYKDVIELFLKEKLGKHGNKNSGRELEKGTKYEWTTSLGLLKEIAGNLEVVEGKEANTLIEKIANAIHADKLPDGSDKAPRTKSGYANKIKQFGNWLELHDHIRKNPFGKLQQKFKYKIDRPKLLISNDELIRLFSVAVTDKKCSKLIPYLALYFFSTLRPWEVAAPEGYLKRNLQWNKLLFSSPWKQIPDSIHVEVTEFDNIKNGRAKIQKRMSKSKSRQGLVFPSGVEWLKYYIEHFGEPEKVFCSVKGLARLKKLANVTWAKEQADWGRHTIASCSCKHYVFDGVIDFLCRRFGHDYSTQQEYYERPVTEDRASQYLGITPASVLDHVRGNAGKYPPPYVLK